MKLTKTTVKVDGQEIEVPENPDAEVENTTKISDDVFEYQLKKPIYKDAEKKLPPVTKIVLSEPMVGKMKEFRLTSELKMGDMLVLVFACSDLEFVSTADKIRLKDMMNLIKICSSFLG